MAMAASEKPVDVTAVPEDKLVTLKDSGNCWDMYIGDDAKSFNLFIITQVGALQITVILHVNCIRIGRTEAVFLTESGNSASLRLREWETVNAALESMGCRMRLD